MGYFTNCLTISIFSPSWNCSPITLPAPHLATQSGYTPVLALVWALAAAGGVAFADDLPLTASVSSALSMGERLGSYLDFLQLEYFRVICLSHTDPLNVQSLFSPWQPDLMLPPDLPAVP